MEYQIWLNGEYVDRDKATISMNDRGFKLGDVVFDTSRTFNGTVFRLRDHLVRLYRSLKYVRLNPGMSIDEMERLTLEVVARNEDVRSSLNDDYMITQIVTGGSGQRGDPPNVSIWLSPLGAPRWAPAYEVGAHAVIPKTRAYSPQSLDPKVKHYSRMNFVLAELEAQDVDPDALPLLLDTDGNVSEGTGANFMIVTDGTLRTPRDTSTAPGRIPNDRARNRRHARNTHNRGRSSALRSLHRGRGLLHQHAVLHPTRRTGGQPPNWG